MLITILETCSSTRLVYNLFVEYIRSEIDYFLDLDKDDEFFVQQQISEMVIWHKTNMLTSYADYVTVIANKVKAREFRSNDIKKIMSKGRFLIQASVTGITPFAAKLLVWKQKDKEITHLEKKLELRQQKRLKELLKSEDTLFKDQLDRLTSNFERFFGSLSDAQVSLLKEYSLMTLDNRKIRLKNRTKQQKLFMKFVKTKPNESMLTAYMNKLLLLDNTVTDLDYVSFSKHSLDQFETLLVKIMAISTIAQQNSIVVKLEKYAKDFNSIAKSGF